MYILKVDIHRVDKVRRSSERTRFLLRPYARNTGSATSFSKMSEDIKENDNASITYETISDYVDALNGDLFHYRDSSGLECDAVLHRRNGDYGLIEIKLGGKDNIEKGAQTLKNLTKKIDTDKMKAPSFLMVPTGVGQYAYRRTDGVFVVPIGCLKD